MALLAGFVAEAQNNGTYVMRYIHYDQTGANNYAISHIVSDYGPRNSTGDSFWHRGIDYQPNQQRGNKILSPCNGTIRAIKRTDRGRMFYMIVEGDAGERHFGYAHLFRDKTIPEGQFWEEGPAGREMAIFNENGDDYIIINMDPANRYALAASTITRDTITYKGVLYNIQSGVTTDKPLAILGDSGAAGRIHLHLYAYRNIQQALTDFQSIPNCYDPMAVILLSPRTNFKCRVQNVGINYGSASKSHFKTRVEMPGAGNGNTYTNQMYDVNLVELFVKPTYKDDEPVANWGTTNSSYQYYRGEHTKSYINQGGRPQESSLSMYPISPSDHNIKSSNNGNAQNTGVEPFAYRDNVGRPWDFFWFSDFYPRIRNNHAVGTTLQFARHNLEARYPDGNYEAMLRVYTSVNNLHSSVGNAIPADDSLTSFQIDNFLPFVQKVEAFRVGLPMYMREWKPLDNGGFVIDPDPIVYLNKANLTVKVYTSEAMTRVSLKVNGYFTEQTQASNEAMTEWTFEVPAANLVDKARNKLEIDGIDLHNNPMQKNAYTVPIWQGSSWSPLPINGPDTNHEIQIGTPDIDFEYIQLGSGAYQFKAISPHTIYTYNWSFGDGNSCNSCPVRVENNYQKPGVYFVTLDVFSNLLWFSVVKEVIVMDLIVPNAMFDFSPRINDPNRDDEITVVVDFYDKTDGIVSNYLWDFGDGQTSTEKNPKDIVYQPYTNYNVNLTVTNQAGNHSMAKALYFDPTVTPWAGLIPWRQTNYLWDFDVSVENLSPPYTFQIDYGDGYSQTVTESDDYYRFSHYYYTYGRYPVTVLITGKDANGQLTTANNVVEINAQPDELLVGLNDATAPGDKYPYTNVVLQPILENGSGYDENNKFTLIFSFTRIGDPLYHIQRSFTHWGPDFPTYTFQFDKAGDYQVHLSIDVNEFMYTGHAYKPVIIVNAPKYVVANICCQPYQVCQGATNTYFGETSPSEAPGVADNQWFPTNIRWTLFDPQGTIADSKEETFLPEHYIFEKWFTHKYSMSGTYRLRLETWNNSHGYAENGLLDPKYKNTLPFYDVIEKEIVVTTNMAALEIVTDNYRYFTFNADGEPVGSSAFQISNPGALSMNWVIEVPQEFENWIQATPSSGTDLKNGNMANVEITASQYDGESTRYGYFNIHGVDGQGNPVQGSPSWIQFEQWGTNGSGAELICGTNSDQQFGYSVSIDGKVAAIGAPGKDASDQSIAFIYEKSHIGQWVQKARLMPPSGQKHFGRSVALHGEYVIVASSWNAAIYKKPLGGWSGDIQPLKVLETNITNSDYGFSVAIWGDYAVVGDREHGFDQGCVYVYYRNQGGIDNWGRDKLLFGQSSDDFFGTSVDIYNDLIAVGAPQQNNNNGYIDLFYRNLNINNPWTLEKRILATLGVHEGPNVGFGRTVSLFEDRLAATFNSRYFSINGWIHYLNFALFNRTVYRNWPLFDISGINNSYNVGESISSISIFEDLESNNENPYNYTFLSGGPSFYDNIGTAFTSFFQYIDYDYFSFDTYNFYELSLIEYSTGNKFGHSLDQSYHSRVVGVSGYQGTGCVVFRNLAKRNSLCDAGIDLVFENFTKPAGAFDAVNAHNITIGGNSMPAVLSANSVISYSANEIVLKDGFLAMYGSDFSAEAEDCYNQENDDQKQLTITEDFLSIESTIERQSELKSKHGQDAHINISDVLKQLTITHKDFPWHRFNFYDQRNSIGIYDQKLNNLLTEKKLTPSLMVDFSFEEKGNICVFVFKNEETDLEVKFLMPKFLKEIYDFKNEIIQDDENK